MQINDSYIRVTIPFNEEVLLNHGTISGAISGVNREELEMKEKIIFSRIEANPNFKYVLENIHNESVDSLLPYSNGIKKKYSNSPILPGVIWRINTKNEGILCFSSFIWGLVLFLTYRIQIKLFIII